MKKCYQLELDIRTWNADSDGMYNYKTENYTKVIDESLGDQFIVRKNNNYITKKTFQSEIDFENDTILFRTRKSLKNDYQYEIINPIGKHMKRNEMNINNLNNKLWYIIKSETENNCPNENEDYI